jgi:outer membrane protein assembly factor BamE (lipoprotein component of BamABCDE complex)
MIKIAMVVLIFMLGGCVSTGVLGTEITESQIASLVPGKTTYQEVKALLGDPMNERLHRGNLRVLYIHSVTKSNIASSLAMMTGQGAIKTRSRTLSLIFDKNFILIERPTVSKGGSTKKF